MLQFSGFGAVSQDFVDCIAEGGDHDVCAALHPATSDNVVVEQFDPSMTSNSVACSICNPNTQWCDEGRCVPFTAAEMAQWATAGKPASAVVTHPAPAHYSMFMGFPVKTLAIAGAIGLGLLLLYKRRA